MDSEKNKKIMLAVGVICIVVAAVLFFSRSTESGGPPGGVGDMAYKCTKCGQGQMINRNTAMDLARKQGTGAGFGPPTLNCPACGAQRTLMPAQRCSSCQEFFFAGDAKDPQSPLKCPKCGNVPAAQNPLE